MYEMYVRMYSSFFWHTYTHISSSGKGDMASQALYIVLVLPVCRYISRLCCKLFYANGGIYIAFLNAYAFDDVRVSSILQVCSLFSDDGKIVYIYMYAACDVCVTCVMCMTCDIDIFMMCVVCCVCAHSNLSLQGCRCEVA